MKSHPNKQDRQKHAQMFDKDASQRSQKKFINLGSNQKANAKRGSPDQKSNKSIFRTIRQEKSAKQKQEKDYNFDKEMEEQKQEVKGIVIRDSMKDCVRESIRDHKERRDPVDHQLANKSSNKVNSVQIDDSQNEIYISDEENLLQPRQPQNQSNIVRNSQHSKHQSTQNSHNININISFTNPSPSNNANQNQNISQNQIENMGQIQNEYARNNYHQNRSMQQNQLQDSEDVDIADAAGQQKKSLLQNIQQDQIQSASSQMIVMNKIQSELVDVSKRVDRIKRIQQQSSNNNNEDLCDPISKDQPIIQSHNSLEESKDQKLASESQINQIFQSKISNEYRDLPNIPIKEFQQQSNVMRIDEEKNSQKSHSQSNEIDDLDEQNLHDIQMNQINQPYGRIQPRSIGLASQQQQLQPQIIQINSNSVLNQNPERAKKEMQNQIEDQKSAFKSSKRQSLAIESRINQINDNNAPKSARQINSINVFRQNNKNNNNLQFQNQNTPLRLRQYNYTIDYDGNDGNGGINHVRSSSYNQRPTSSIIRTNSLSYKNFPHKNTLIQDIQNKKQVKSQIFQAADINTSNSTTLLLNNIMKQLEDTRKQLETKDRQMQQLNFYVQEVIKENSNLQMRLSVYERNNQMLLRQVHQLRANQISNQQLHNQHHTNSSNLSDGLNLFEQQMQMQLSSYIRQPRKPSGKITQKMNHKDQTLDNFSDKQLEQNTILDCENALDKNKDIKDEKSPRFNDNEENKHLQLAHQMPHNELQERLNTSKGGAGEDEVIKPTIRGRRRYNINKKMEQLQDQPSQENQILNVDNNSNQLCMEENILPSISSARNTQRRLNFDPSKLQSEIGVLNFERQKLLDLNLNNTSSNKNNSAPRAHINPMNASIVNINSQWDSFPNIDSTNNQQLQNCNDINEVNRFPQILGLQNIQTDNTPIKHEQENQNEIGATLISSMNLQQIIENRYQAQQVNSFVPPTRASQSLISNNNTCNKIQSQIDSNRDLSDDYKLQQHSDDSVEDENDKREYIEEDDNQNASNNDKIVLSNLTEEQSNQVQSKLDFSFDQKQLSNSSKDNMQQPNQIDDEEDKQDVQNEMKGEMLKINKVNEMDVKVSRFDLIQSNNNRQQINNSNNLFIEELIPNEEPLIQIREFTGAGVTSYAQQFQSQNIFHHRQNQPKTTKKISELKQQNDQSNDLSRNNQNISSERRINQINEIFGMSNIMDDSMSNFDHQSEIHQINYPRVNINSGNQNRMQNIQNKQFIFNEHQNGLMSLANVDERADTKNNEPNEWGFERNALNRNVFNNQRRVLNNQHVKQSKLCQEEERKSQNDDQNQPNKKSLNDRQNVMKQTIQPQKTQNQITVRKQQISNVSGDNGNDSLIDIDDDNENNINETNQINQVNQIQQIKDNCSYDQNNDCLDHIDNIDLNIEENLQNSNQRSIQIQNISNLANLSQMRFQRSIISQNINPLNNQARNQDTNSQTNRRDSSNPTDLNNQSFSQLSQIGENLAENRESDNSINQIRISNRNFPNHSYMNNNLQVNQMRGNNRMRERSLLSHISNIHQQNQLNQISQLNSINSIRNTLTKQQQIAQMQMNTQQLQRNQVRNNNGNQQLQQQMQQQSADSSTLFQINEDNMDVNEVDDDDAERNIQQYQQTFLVNNLNQHLHPNYHRQANISQSIQPNTRNQLSLVYQSNSNQYSDAAVASLAEQGASIMNLPNNSLRMPNSSNHNAPNVQNVINLGLQQRSSQRQSQGGAQAENIRSQDADWRPQINQNNIGRSHLNMNQNQINSNLRQPTINLQNIRGIRASSGGLAGQVPRGEGMLQFDDMGLDEYDVADERQHEIGFDRWEINIDNMTYEDLLQLQERIGYVNKGLDLDQIKSFPQMKKSDLKKYIKSQLSKHQGQKQSKQKIKQRRQNELIEENKQSENLQRMQSITQLQSNRNYNGHIQPQVSSLLNQRSGSALQPVNSMNNVEQISLSHMLNNASRSIMQPQNEISKQIRAAQLRIEFENDNQNELNPDIMSQILDNHIEEHLESQIDNQTPKSSQIQQHIQSQFNKNGGRSVYSISDSNGDNNMINNLQNVNYNHQSIVSSNQLQQQLSIQQMKQKQLSLQDSKKKQIQQQLELNQINEEINEQNNRIARQQRNPVVEEDKEIEASQSKQSSSLSNANPKDYIMLNPNSNSRNSQFHQSSILPIQRLNLDIVDNNSFALHNIQSQNSLNLAGCSELVSGLISERQSELRNLIDNQEMISKNNKRKRNNHLVNYHSQNVSLQQNQQHYSRQQSNPATCNTSQIKIDDCAICYDTISDSQTIKLLKPCNHYFHNNCINQWLIIEKKCPMCMRNLNVEEAKENENNAADVPANESQNEDLLNGPNEPSLEPSEINSPVNEMAHDINEGEASDHNDLLDLNVDDQQENLHDDEREEQRIQYIEGINNIGNIDNRHLQNRQHRLHIQVSQNQVTRPSNQNYSRDSMGNLASGSDGVIQLPNGSHGANRVSVISGMAGSGISGSGGAIGQISASLSVHGARFGASGQVLGNLRAQQNNNINRAVRNNQANNAASNNRDAE